MRKLLVVALVVTSGCSIRGLGAESRSVGPGRAYAQASRPSVFDRATGWFRNNGYRITQSSPPERIRGEKSVAMGNVNVIDVRFEQDSANLTSFYPAGWTDVVKDGARRRASSHDLTLANDINDLVHFQSCPVARWPACP
jgi:hypothetical protein